MLTFNCDFCSFTSDYKCNVLRHIKAKHSHPEKSSNVNTYKCPLCTDVKARAKDVLYHYKAFHGLDVDEICYEFDDQERFQEWKRKIEDKDKTFYVIGCGHPRTCGKIKKTLHCHRSGFYKDQGKHIRKSKGSNKINGYCPSRMRTITDLTTGRVTVYFISLHVGHTNEIERLPLKKVDKLVLARKLVAGVGQSRTDAIDDVPLDNVDELVNEIVSSNNMVRLFKPQGKLLEDQATLDINDFMLVISTDQQLSLLERHGSNIVAMNGTHGLNPSSVVLTTILAVGDDRVFPCAFLLSNRSDVEVMTLFVQTVRSAMNRDVQVTTFMTDMAGIFYDSWSNVMPTPKNRLFSTFLVEQAWKKNLPKIRDRTKKEYTLNCLRKLLEESSNEAFFRLLPATVAHLLADPGTSEFGDYFASEFSNNYHSWASCFREYCSPGVDKNLKSTFKTLKRVCCLEGRKTIRLEKAVPSLLDFVTSESFKSLQEGADLLTLAAIQQRHESSRSIPVHHVDESGEGWIVKARNSDDDFYFVELKTDTCNCRLRCEDCRCCVHSYQCSCFDSCVENNMCEHIHRLAFLRSQISGTVDESGIRASPMILEEGPTETDTLLFDDDSPEVVRLIRGQEPSAIVEFSNEDDPPDDELIHTNDPSAILKFINEGDPPDVELIHTNDTSVVVEYIDEDKSSVVVGQVHEDDPSTKVDLIRKDDPIQTARLIAEDDPSKDDRASVRLIRDDTSETEESLLEELSGYIRTPDEDIAVRDRVAKMWTEIRTELKFTSDYEVLERALKPILPAMLAARQHQGEIFWIGQDSA